MAAIVMALSVTPASVAGADPLYFHLYAHYCYVGGHASGGPVTLSVTSADGVSKGRETGIVVDSSGSWSASRCYGDGIEAGDRVTASFGSVHRTFIVPALHANANRVSNVVRGYGPPASNLKVTLARCQVPSSDCSPTPERTVPTDATGRFSTTFAADDPRGGDYAYVNWTGPMLDTLTQYVYFPYVRVWIGRSYLSGQGKLDGSVTTTLTSAAGAVRGKARSTPDHAFGSFTGIFATSNGQVAYVRATDRVRSTVASDASFSVPPIDVVGNAATAMVSGRCLPNRTVLVVANDPTYTRVPYSLSTTTMAGPDGSFSADMAAGSTGFVLTAGDQVDATCSTPAGDAVGRQATAH
jgi:hypothetical protein